MFSDLTFSLALCFSTCAHCCAKGSEAPSKWIVCDAVSTKLRWRLHQLWLLHAPQSPSGHRVGSCFCFTTAVSHLSGCHNHYVYGSGTSVLYGWQFRSSIHGDATHVSPKCALIVSLQTPKFEQQVIWAHIEQVLVIAWQRGLDARYWHCCDIKVRSKNGCGMIWIIGRGVLAQFLNQFHALILCSLTDANLCRKTWKRDGRSRGLLISSVYINGQTAANVTINLFILCSVYNRPIYDMKYVYSITSCG